MFEHLKSLLITALKGEEPSTDIDFVRETYRTDINIDDLVMELKRFKTLYKLKNEIRHCVCHVKLFKKSVSDHYSMDFLGKGRVFKLDSLFRVSTLLYTSSLHF